MSRHVHPKIRTLATLLLLLAVACDFRPVFVANAPVHTEMAAVEIALIADRTGQLLRNRLLDRLTPTGIPRYLLSVQLTERKQNLAIRRDLTATRANLTLTAQFKLTANRTDELLLQGRSRSLNSYNISTFDFATLSAENDARHRAARAVAADIATQLAIYFDAEIGH